MQSNKVRILMSLLLFLSFFSTIYLSNYDRTVNESSTIDALKVKSENIFVDEEKKFDHNIWIKVVLKNIIKVVII